MTTPERALQLAKRITARYVNMNDLEHEDIVQEAALEILQAAERRPDMPEAYLVGAGRRQVWEKSKERTWTGMATNMGTPVDPLRRPHGSVDEMLSGEDGAISTDLLAVVQQDEPGFEQAEWRAMAAEHLDIAIKRLPHPDQQAVVVGIRDGMTIPESLPNVPKKTAQSTWHRARKQLREELAWMTDEEGKVAA